jgi:ABC-type multidrug transport system fused ATPase/permease subunit
LVQEAIDRLMKGRTVFVIAHRLSTIQNADKIVVLDDGKIVQVGNHNSLMQQEGLYKRLYEMQFKM